MTLTKADIISTIQENLQFPRKECVDIVEDLLEIMKQTMSRGEDILISGFGKFCIKDKKQRRGRNPSTGDDMILHPRRVVTFRCSGKLRNKINI